MSLELPACHHGPTVIVAFWLVMLPDEAVIVTVPVATAVTVPASTVAICELLVFQVATLVISSVPLHVCAVAVIDMVWGLLETDMVPTVGLSEIDWMQPTVTFTVCVPVMDGF